MRTIDWNLAAAATITEPGVHDIPEDEYHRDPVVGGSLSHTGARKLLPPSCPALFKHWREHPPLPTEDFDFGHAAHKVVLGAGADLAVIDAEDWRTKAAREARMQAHAEGKIPVLTCQHLTVLEMARALREHPIASALLAAPGRAEQTLVWRDQRTAVMRRALVDHLPEPGPGRYILPDYKTSKSAAPEAIRRTMADFGYHTAADWYLAGIQALGIAADPAFVLIVQEKTAPYLVTVGQPDSVAMRIGRDLNREALDLYAQCTAEDHWPGYSSEVELIPLPVWVENQYRKDPW